MLCDTVYVPEQEKEKHQLSPGTRDFRVQEVQRERKADAVIKGQGERREYYGMLLTSMGGSRLTSPSDDKVISMKYIQIYIHTHRERKIERRSPKNRETE